MKPSPLILGYPHAPIPDEAGGDSRTAFSHIRSNSFRPRGDSSRSIYITLPFSLLALGLIISSLSDLSFYIRSHGSRRRRCVCSCARAGHEKHYETRECLPHMPLFVPQETRFDLD